MTTGAKRRLAHAVVLSLGAVMAPACSSEQAEVADTGPGRWTESGCTPGQQIACTCPDGLPGVRQCLPDGSGYSDCDCEYARGQRLPRCENGVCDEDYGENCNTCPEDCGVCAPCDIAPSCEYAQIPPSEVTHMPELDVLKMQLISAQQLREYLASQVAWHGAAMRVLAAALDTRHDPEEHPLVTHLRRLLAQHPAASARLREQLQRAGMSSVAAYRAAHPLRRRAAAARSAVGETRRIGDENGTAYPPTSNEFPLPMECGRPFLRAGVSSITVHEEDDDIANDIVYCVVQSEADYGAEVRVTPKTPNLDEGDSFVYSIDEGVFWGQIEPTHPGSDILVTYDCIEADTDDGYVELLAAIGQASMSIGGVIPGEQGWIFTVVGVVATIVAGALALDGDDALFHAQQFIPEEQHLMMTNGVYWSVRRDGTHVLSDWDWELFIKAWGCAEYGTL